MSRLLAGLIALAVLLTAGLALAPEAQAEADETEASPFAALMEAALDQVETALGRVSQNRAALGAQENRFQRAIEQREIGAENTAASESAILDLDYDRQFVEQTRNEILLQTGIAAVAQSSLQNQVAAGLLGT